MDIPNTVKRMALSTDGVKREILKDKLAFQKPQKPNAKTNKVYLSPRKSKSGSSPKTTETDSKLVNAFNELAASEEKYCLNLKDILHVRGEQKIFFSIIIFFSCGSKIDL